MAENTIDLSAITIPTPEPYSKKDPDQQRENLAYVALQVLSQMKTQGATISTATQTGDIVQAINDLQYQGVVLESEGVQLYLTRKSGGVITP